MKKEKQDHIDFELCTDEQLNITEKEYSHFFTDLEVDVFISRMYKYKNYYMCLDIDFVKNTCWTSIIKMGDKNENILAPSIRFLNRIAAKFQIGFCWEKGYKSEILIKRLAKNFKIVDRGETPRCKYMILN